MRASHMQHSHARIPYSRASLLPGLINDMMANYTTTYYLLGALSLLPAVLWSLVPLVNREKIKNPV